MGKPNYQYEKRQRDIANKKKKEEKRNAKLAKSRQGSQENPEAAAPPSEETE